MTIYAPTADECERCRAPLGPAAFVFRGRVYCCGTCCDGKRCPCGSAAAARAQLRLV